MKMDSNKNNNSYEKNSSNNIGEIQRRILNIPRMRMITIKPKRYVGPKPITTSGSSNHSNDVDKEYYINEYVFKALLGKKKRYLQN